LIGLSFPENPCWEFSPPQEGVNLPVLERPAHPLDSYRCVVFAPGGATRTVVLRSESQTVIVLVGLALLLLLIGALIRARRRLQAEALAAVLLSFGALGLVAYAIPDFVLAFAAAVWILFPAMVLADMVLRRRRTSARLAPQAQAIVLYGTLFLAWLGLSFNGRAWPLLVSMALSAIVAATIARRRSMIWEPI